MQFHVPPKESRTAVAARVASAYPTATAWIISSPLRFGEAHAPIARGAPRNAPKYVLVRTIFNSMGSYACSIRYWVGCAIWSRYICSLAHIFFYRKASDYLDKDVRLSLWRASSSAVAQYCCGDSYTTQKSSSLACVDGGPVFTLPNATPVLGVAGLGNAQYVSSTNSTSDASSATMPTAGSPAQDDDCSSQKKDTITVGSFLGVSLVAVTIALVLWALWERRQKILWWQRAIGLAPEWPPKHAAWMRSLGQKSSKPPPCPITRAKLLYAAHQQHKHAQEQQPAPTCGTHQPEISSPQRPREMPGQDVTPPAAEMDAT